MTTRLRVLHLEDNPRDANLISRRLQADGLDCEICFAPQRDAFETLLSEQSFDLILSDYSVPGFDGLSALSVARAKAPGVPFILVSGTLGEEQAVESLKAGATDYILKERLIRLVPAIRRALDEAAACSQRKQSAEELRRSQELFRQILGNVEDLIAVVDLQGRRVFISPSYERLFGQAKPLIGTDLLQDVHPEDQERVREIIRTMIDTGHGQRMEYRFLLNDGAVRFIESQGSVIRDARGALTQILLVSRDVTERKHAEEEIQKTHKKLIETSRLAGMAEVATGVLHNIGNVLNSVTVTASIIITGVRKSKSAKLAKVVGLLREHESDLGGFLMHDSKGKTVLEFLGVLAHQLEEEREALLRELDQLRKNIDHIGEVVSAQQGCARTSGVMENVNVSDLIEDTLRMSGTSFTRRQVEVVRDFQTVQPLMVQKHKVLQILVNLVRNATDACGAHERPDKRITISLKEQEGQIRVEISDNGIGMGPETLTRLFNHGFTTKKGGHGFGLHSSALTAKELGGSLSAHSDGSGRGATFTLQLPGQPARDK